MTFGVLPDSYHKFPCLLWDIFLHRRKITWIWGMIFFIGFTSRLLHSKLWGPKENYIKRLICEAYRYFPNYWYKNIWRYQERWGVLNSWQTTWPNYVLFPMVILAAPAATVLNDEKTKLKIRLLLEVMWSDFCAHWQWSPQFTNITPVKFCCVQK